MIRAATVLAALGVLVAVVALMNCGSSGKPMDFRVASFEGRVGLSRRGKVGTSHADEWKVGLSFGVQITGITHPEQVRQVVITRNGVVVLTVEPQKPFGPDELIAIDPCTWRERVPGLCHGDTWITVPGTAGDDGAAEAQAHFEKAAKTADAGGHYGLVLRYAGGEQARELGTWKLVSP